jgi:hypothetical protein
LKKSVIDLFGLFVFISSKKTVVFSLIAISRKKIKKKMPASTYPGFCKQNRAGSIKPAQPKKLI